MTLEGLQHLHTGKVRDLYAVGNDQILMVASDRISAYDYILPTEIPDKGAILTALSLWWFDQLSDVVDNHLITADVRDYPASLQPHADFLRGRSMLCRRLDMVPVECVARGYLTGSGFVDYTATGAICGIPLPAGLLDGSRLQAPIFTPASKAAVGDHDENVSYATVAAQIGDASAAELRSLTLAAYSKAVGIAAERGIIIADTKFEFGRAGDGFILGDEVLTPDSSRFWPADAWVPGRPQPSYDKQYVRDWLRLESGWDRNSQPPRLPDDVVGATRARYVDAYEKLTGLTWS
ncbi:MAG: phosphoribosylaminoimidazole-succinocarboxamide synthase [Frankiales bacterium]|nr:phosphoribosylaminoimidazole-succinocarboxamide synthase [Frankiales bacterium]